MVEPGGGLTSVLHSTVLGSSPCKALLVGVQGSFSILSESGRASGFLLAPF